MPPTVYDAAEAAIKIERLERENAALKVQVRELIATMEEEGEMDAVRIAELKKENATLRADNQAAHALVLDLRAKEHSERTLAVKLEKDNAELRADKERLNFMLNAGIGRDLSAVWRAAIDAARKEVQS